VENSRILVTGGAGFIRSHLVKYLVKKNNFVYIFDNFSSKDNLKDFKSDHLQIIKGDCSSLSDLQKIPSELDMVFHLAADPEVRLTKTNPQSIFRNNIQATYNLLEWFRDSLAHTIVFTSSSTVYGEANIIPTPESYPCFPISLYGASKLTCESLLSAYCHTYKKKGVTIRLANVVGASSGHGIIFDMVTKLKNNPNEIEILGDGNQKKSYLYIDDCISGILKAVDSIDSTYNVYNLGSDSQITVKEIVDLILSEHGLLTVKKRFTGGVDGGRGWMGDVKNMMLDIKKINRNGWTHQLNSEEAIRKTVRDIIRNKISL